MPRSRGEKWYRVFGKFLRKVAFNTAVRSGVNIKSAVAAYSMRRPSMNFYRAVRRCTFLKAMLGLEPFYWVNRLNGVVEFGSKYGNWGIDTTNLGHSTVVVSFGLGEDVTFESALLKRFNCQIFGFDPTPCSVEFTAKNVRHPKFVTTPFALAAHDGTIAFTAPPKSATDQVSASAIASYCRKSNDTVNVPCLTLESALKKCGTSKVDVLKMDIEGAEFAVIEQAVANGWLQEVSQILVEFHHFLPGLSSNQTRSAVSALQNAGFEIAWIGRTNHEYLFTRSHSAAA